MTVVDQNTGEIVDFDKAAAERRAERISLRLDAVADNYEAAVRLIREAIEKRDDIALGYRSVGDYLSDRFAGALTRLGLDARRAVVGELTEAGMSTRAIAPVVGVSNYTVHGDQAAVRDLTPQTPEPSARREAGTTQETDTEGESGNPGLGAGGDPHVSRPPVTGVDGKVYSRPEPRAPKPVLVGDDAEYDNAEQASKSLARAIAKLLEFEHPNMRAGMRRYWDMASIEVPPAQRADVTKEQMRAAAQGLLALADEWNR